MSKMKRLLELEEKAGASTPEPDLSPYGEWIERHLRVVSEVGGGDLLPLAFNPIQQALNETYDRLRARGPARIIVLKARRHGVSTWWQSRIFERITRTPNIRALVLANEDETSGELFDISRLFLECLGDISPARMNDSGQRIRYAPPHWSQLRVQTAFRHKGSGMTVHMLHASELAKWSDPATTMLSLRQAAREADVLIESTANGQLGQGAYFFNEWQRAQRGESGYVPLFFAWFHNPLYTIAEDDPQFEAMMDRESLSDEEAALQDAHKLTDGQMAWRRRTIANECGGVVDDFRQEYPSNPDEAFLRVEGRRVFDLGACSSHRAIAERFNTDSPPIVGRLEWATQPVLDHTGRCTNRDKLSVRFSADEHGPLRIWIPPDTEGPHIRYRYIGAGDVAKGVEGGDSNSGAILDRQQRVICAAWHELCDATLFGEYMARLAVFYDAEVAIEVNGVGHSALVKLLEIAGPRYTWATHKFQPGNPVDEWDRGKWGWTTSDRHYMAEGLRDVIRENRWIDPDIEAWGEIMGIVHEASGRPAFSGRDRTMARAILARVDEMAPPVRMPEEEQPQRRDYSDWRAKQAREERRWNSGASGDWRTRGVTTRVAGGDHRLIVGRRQTSGDWRTRGLTRT